MNIVFVNNINRRVNDIVLTILESNNTLRFDHYIRELFYNIISYDF